jgi:hypothetical protein
VHNGSALTTGVGGLPVTFTVAAGNGSLRLIGSELPGASSVTSITNTNPINPESPTSGGGFAPVNWTLPETPGTYTLTATGPATGGPVTFTATIPVADIGLGVLNGSWINEDQELGNITRINIGVEGNSATVEQFGRCVPTDCPFGVVDGNTSQWGTLQVLNAFWDHGFATRTEGITYLSANRIMIVMFTDFTEADGRTDYTITEFFTREVVIP